jgi:hypothetical protein
MEAGTAHPSCSGLATVITATDTTATVTMEVTVPGGMLMVGIPAAGTAVIAEDSRSLTAGGLT